MVKKLFLISPCGLCRRGINKETKIKRESIKKLEASLETIPTTDVEVRGVVIKKLFIMDPLNKRHSSEKNICDQLTIEKEKELLEFQKSIEQINILISRWDNTEKLARNLPRIALANPVSALQAIKRESEGVEVTECIRQKKNKLASGMGRVIDGYISFMGKNDESIYVSNIIAGKTLMIEYMERASACGPQ